MFCCIRCYVYCGDVVFDFDLFVLISEFYMFFFYFWWYLCGMNGNFEIVSGCFLLCIFVNILVLILLMGCVIYFMVMGVLMLGLNFLFVIIFMLFFLWLFSRVFLWIGVFFIGCRFICVWGEFVLSFCKICFVLGKLLVFWWCLEIVYLRFVLIGDVFVEILWLYR